MATVISSASFVAHPGAVFTKSLYLLPAHIALPAILLFVAYIIVPFYRRVVGMSWYRVPSDGDLEMAPGCMHRPALC